MSTAYAAIGSLFNNSPESLVNSPVNIELATDYKNIHDGLELSVDGAMTLVDESVVHDLLFADSSHDNQGSGGVSVSIFTQIIPDSADWNHVYFDDGSRYELTSVPLPTEIRPPITL